MVPHMSDEELKSLGINKIGDRYELRNQCQAPGNFFVMEGGYLTTNCYFFPVN